MVKILASNEKGKATLDGVTKLLSRLSIPWSLYLVPVNLDEEREKFLSESDYNPIFKYCKPKNSNEEVFKELDQVKEIADVEPQISEFILKVIKDKKQASDILFAIGNDQEFVKLCGDRFGVPGYSIFKKACKILRGSYGDILTVQQNDKLSKKILHFDDIVPIFENAFVTLGLEGWSVDKSKAIVSSGVRTAAKTKRIMVDPEIETTAEKIKKTIIHEVVTHALRAENGLKSGFEVFSKPNLADGLDDEEGLAMYNEELYGVLRDTNVRHRAALVYAAYLGQTMSFRQVFNALRAVYPKNTAFGHVFRIKRGLSDTSNPGCYYKDVSYLRGFLKLRKILPRDVVSYKYMYAGKIPLKYLDLVEEGVIPKAKVVPSKELISKMFKKTALD